MSDVSPAELMNTLSAENERLKAEVARLREARAAAIEEVHRAVSELTFEGGDKSWSKLLVLRAIRGLIASPTIE